MRLTLRTLLAYLDDTLEPAQAKLIGQKIAESDQARELIERIQQVTRRRRITTPPDGGPGGKLDANTLGEYLDNAVTPEQAAEVEEICLASDTHLAEIAACHQILSLILGEPALVPPSAKQRMYGLVKGPEAIPFRKPPATGPKGDIDMAEGRDVDDTLRLGMSPVTGTQKGNPWLLIAVGAAAACLLLVTVWQILKGRDETPIDPNKNVQVVQADPYKDKVEASSDGKKDIDHDKKDGKDHKKDGQKDEQKTETKDGLEIKLPPVVVDVPPAPPSTEVKAAGQLVANAKDPAILLRYDADKTEWRRLGPKNPEVSTGQALVSLPGAKSAIQLGNGLKLTLVGSIFPELFFSFPLYESRVELHAHEQLDLDLTLRRGRVRIASPERPARIRVRFENPTQPGSSEHFDISLQTPETEVLVDRWFYIPRNEKFIKNPKDPNRAGPAADMACVVLSGSIQLRFHDLTHTLTAPPGQALVSWKSRKGLDAPVKLDVLPEGLKTYQPLPPSIEPRQRTDILRARDEMQKQLLVKAVDVVLAEGLKSPDLAMRRMTVLSLGAVDEVSAVLEQLEQDTAPDLRLTAIDVLRNWIAAGRDHDYKLYDLLKMKYRAFEAENIMTLLHGYSDKDLQNPDTYELLISYLNHSLLPIRELAGWQLYQLVPAGQKIRYSASADASSRQQAQTAWRALIPANQLPPMPMKK